MLKWIIHKVSGQCELLRITYRNQQRAARTKCIENSLKNSSKAELRRLVEDKDINIDANVALVMKVKIILPEVHQNFEREFRESLIQINGYVKLRHTVDELRKVQYSCDNPSHEDTLMKFWNVLTDGEVLPSRVCSQWTQLGFQGDDPQTDFRCMGQLALDQLLYFATKYTEMAKSMLSKATIQYHGYSFAIAGINITALVVNLLMNGCLRTHFYNHKADRPTLEDFHEVFCYSFRNFDLFWYAEQPDDIMEFEKVLEKFHRTLETRLTLEDAKLVNEFRHEDY